MNLELKGAKIAIAGSSKGLGFAIAKAFFDEGAFVWLTGRHSATLKEASEKLNGALHSVCDLETVQGRKSFLRDVQSTWGTLDALILNVGSGQVNHPGIDTSDEEFLRVFQLNFFSHASLIRLFRPLLKKSINASILSVSSIAGEMRTPAPLAYGAAKAALNQYCLQAANELAQDKIRLNIIAPGNVLVPGGRWQEKLEKNPQEVNHYIESSVPMKRFATAEEVAANIVFLTSKKAGFNTGASFRVDGGQSTHL